MTAPIVWLRSARSTSSWSAEAMAWVASPLIWCLAGMSVDLALDNRIADPRLLPMCTTVRATTLGFLGIHTSLVPEGLMGLNPGTAAAALISVCIGYRTTSAGAGWVRAIRCVSMVITMLVGMQAGCFIALRLAALLRMPAASTLIWAMMASGMLIAHGILWLCRAAFGLNPDIDGSAEMSSSGPLRRVFRRPPPDL